MTPHALLDAFHAVVTDLHNNRPPRLDARCISEAILAEPEVREQPLDAILTHVIAEIDGGTRPLTVAEGAQRILALCNAKGL